MATDPTKPQSAAQAAKPAATPPPFMITPLKQEHRYIKCLFYGKFGDGKTSLAGSAVDVTVMRDVLLVNAESGAMSIEEADHIKNRYQIDQVGAKDFTMVARVQEFLLAHCKARDANNVEAMKSLQARLFGYAKEIIDESATEDVFEDDGYTFIKARLRRYRTVIIDSLTEIDMYSMYHLLGIKTDMKLDADIDVAQFAEFRKNNQMVNLLVRAYRDLPMNVLLVTSTQYVQDEMKQMHWTPALTGKLSGQVQGFVDLVGFLQTGKPETAGAPIPRRLYIQPIGKFDAKSRMAGFKDPYIDQPTMGKIWAAFNASKGK